MSRREEERRAQAASRRKHLPVKAGRPGGPMTTKKGGRGYERQPKHKGRDEQR